MSKWNLQMDEKLRNMCIDGVPNAEIAVRMQLPVTDIYARRSHLGITQEKAASLNDKNKTDNDRVKCDCCGLLVDETETYIMPNDENREFCESCARVADYINEN